MSVLTGSFEERLRKSISFTWQVFREKAGSKLLSINKEASMQLLYSHILLQVIPLICFHEDESVKIELETGVNVNGRRRNIDLVLKGIDSYGCNHNIAVEMKCYRKVTSSGGSREAVDYFTKDVYVDLNSLEEYCEYAEFNRGVSLVMNDLEMFVNPKKKTAKYWDYDISHGTKVGNVHLTTPIGGEKIDVRLEKSYEFNWIQCGDFWFLEIEGH